MARRIVLALAALCGSCALPARGDNICGSNETIGHAVIGAVNLSWPGMGAVGAAASSGDLGTACEARPPPPSNAHVLLPSCEPRHAATPPAGGRVMLCVRAGGRW